MNFRENFKKDMKKCDHHIADLRKQLASRYASVEKVRNQDTGIVQGWRATGRNRNQQELQGSKKRLLFSIKWNWEIIEVYEPQENALELPDPGQMTGSSVS